MEVVLSSSQERFLWSLSLVGARVRLHPLGTGSGRLGLRHVADDLNIRLNAGGRPGWVHEHSMAGNHPKAIVDPMAV